MMTKEKIIEKLNEYSERLMEYKGNLNEKKNECRKFFFEKYDEWGVTDEEGKEITCDEKGFDKLYSINVNYINQQKEFVEKILSLDIMKENRFNNQIVCLLEDCIHRMNNEFEFAFKADTLFSVAFKDDYSEAYKSILLLAKFTEVDKNVVLIGGNGSGKSSFANELKGNDTENICVVPAQKSLYFSMEDMSMLSTRKSDLVELLLENNISKSKTKDDYEYFRFQNKQFTKLIIAMKEQYTEHLIDCEENGKILQGDKTIFGQLRILFKSIFPEIRLHFSSDAKDYFTCEKNGKQYHVNALSEGEKAVIYYAVSVFMAKKNSFIVVDEPETYLNPSLTNLLWDYLIKIREDCQFIFITHSVDFVLGRNDAKIAWIKNFQYPDEWEIEFVNEEFSLPKTLMTEILGSKKPIAFCEGDDKSSLDYTIYRSLLGKEYTIVPVGGHMEVIKNCEVLLESSWLNVEAIGIVDGDNLGTEKIENLKRKKVNVLPYNEIEMFLVCEEILEATMKSIYPVDYLKKILIFKEKFFEYAEKHKEKMALNNVMLRANEYIAKEKIQDIKSIDGIKESLKRISEYKIEEQFEEKKKQISKIVEDRDYNKLLIVCNLKKEISRGVANVHLDSNYEEKALQQIQTNEKLRDALRKEYFGL